MNKCIFSLLTVLSFILPANAAYNWNNPSTPPSGYTHATYHSALMNTDVGYVIFLPPNYANSTDHYPVVYSLHGLGGNENSNPSTYTSVLQSGMTGNTFSPMIYVFINGRGNTFYSDSKDGKVKCESTIIKELIPHIDSTYRTKADRTQRAIEGISMGGFGALMLGFKHPETFASIGTYDAALVNWDTLSQQQFDQSTPKDIFGSDRQYFNENSYPFTFAKKNAETIKSLGIKVKMFTGSNDFSMGPLYPYNCQMRDTLNKLGISLDFTVTPGGTHGQNFNANNCKANAIFHSANFKAAQTGVINNFSSVSYANQKPCTFTISSMSNSRIYGLTSDAASVFDLSGRAVSQLRVGKQFSSGVHAVKAVK